MFLLTSLIECLTKIRYFSMELFVLEMLYILDELHALAAEALESNSLMSTSSVLKDL